MSSQCSCFSSCKHFTLCAPCSRAMRKQKQRSIQYGLRPVCCLCRLDQMLRPLSTLCRMQNMNDVCLASSSSAALLLLLPRQGSQSLILPASGEPQVVICGGDEKRRSRGRCRCRCLVSRQRPDSRSPSRESGLLKKSGHLVSIPSKELPPFCSALPFFSRLLGPRCCLTYHAP